MTSTRAAASAINRTPVEIWRQIFELYLGPSLLEPDVSTLKGYRELFHNEPTLLRNYVSIERRRGVLRLVCSSWDELANTMGDRIVISHLDKYDWPPYRSRKDAELIAYRHYTYYLESNPISVYRRRVGFTRLVRSSTIKLDSNLPLARMTLLVTQKLDTSSIAADVEPADIHSLSFGPCADIHDIAHPIFYNVRTLHLRALYPFQDPDGMERNRTLPNLRCLIIMAECRDLTAPISPLSAWHFPKLAMFRFIPSSFPSQPLEDLVNFIHNHVETLEELELYPLLGRHCAIQIDWSRLPRLKLIKPLELSSIADALPTLAHRWQSTRVSSVDVDVTDVPRRLTIILHLPLTNPTELSAEDVIARLRPYRWAFPHLSLQIDWKRESRWFSQHPNIPAKYLAKRRYVTAFLAIIDQLQLPVFDVGGIQSTDAVNALRAFVSGSS